MRKLLAMGACAALASSAWAGTALFNGVTLGNPVTVIPYAGPNLSGQAVDPAVTAQGGGIFVTPNAFGNLDVTLNIGRIRCVLDLGGGADAFTAVGVPNSNVDGSGAGYVFEAEWLVPKGEEVIPHFSSGGLNSRCFAGMHVGGGAFLDNNGGYSVYGLEWNVGAQNWQLRSDNDGIWGGGTATFAAPAYFKVRSTRDAAGTVFGEYSVDFGPFTAVPSGFPNPLNLFGIGFGAVDGTSDTPAVSWRGRVSSNFRARLTTTDPAIPNTGVGIDSDGDGVNDEDDAWPLDPDFAVDSDNDGLPDEWEILHFGDLSQDATDNPTGSALNNIQDFYAGNDPNAGIPIVPPGAPAAGLLGLLALGGALAFASARKSRK